MIMYKDDENIDTAQDDGSSGVMYNDDENIEDDDASSGNKVESIPEVKVKIHSKASASLEGTNTKVMLELSGKGHLNYRPGLDLVTVLEFQKLVHAMEIVITKLSPIDRLSVVTFGTKASRLCPLRRMTDNSKKEMKLLVSEIQCWGWTNIKEGIQIGLKVLRDRYNTSGRSVGIMLMSDGEQNTGGDATLVEIGKVPVYTFCFGQDDSIGLRKYDLGMEDASASASHARCFTLNYTF